MIISILIFVLVQTYNKNHPLKKFFRIVATSKDPRGVEFITMMEGIESMVFNILIMAFRLCLIERDLLLNLILV